MGLNSNGDYTKKQRKQQTLRMNLDLNKPEEHWLWDMCQSWKKRKVMAVNIRRALDLFIDLEQGGVDLLLQLFPHVYGALKARVLEEVLKEQADRLQEIQDYIVQQEAQKLLEG